MRHVSIRILLLALICLSLSSGCGRSGDDAGDGPQEADRLVIVTSFYPIYLETINIAGGVDGVEVINMTTPQTGCLHDYQLSPRDLALLEEADVFVVNGAGLEAFLDEAADMDDGIAVVNASLGIDLLQNADGTENPHVWVSVGNAIMQVQNIAEQLSSLDKAHGDEYAANADLYMEKLLALEQRMDSALSNVKNKDIITFHEAFPYFADEFDLNIKAVIEREPGTAPSPGELEDVIETIRTSGAAAIFTEPQYQARAAEMVARETGIPVYELDPVVTGIADEDAKDDYIDIMDKNLATLMEALNR